VDGNWKEALFSKTLEHCTSKFWQTGLLPPSTGTPMPASD
jgi:hypothetical protein